MLVFLLVGTSVCHAQSVLKAEHNVISDTSGGKRPVNLQANSTNAADTATPTGKKLPFQPNPKKSGLYSALIPGLGQLYNRQYWKIPLVYAGLGVAGYFLVDNLNKYQSYRQAYIARIANPYYQDQYVNYTSGQLQQLQNDYSKYLDITVLVTGLAYMLQVMDAVTAAHLKNFDISRDISLRMRPVAIPGGVGVGLVVNYK